MAKRTIPVEILGQEYRIRSDSDASTIRRAAALVDETMAKVRDRTGTVDTLDIAVLTALNIANHLISLRDASGTTSQGERTRSYDLGELARYYAAYERLMRHWRRVLPGVVYTLDYETLVDDFDPAGSRILVFGMLSGRDPAEVLSAFATIQADIVLTVTAPSPRGVPSTELADLATELGLAAESCGSVEAAIARAFAVAAEDDAILISGSLYVAGEARSHLLPPTPSESMPPEPD